MRSGIVRPSVTLRKRGKLPKPAIKSVPTLYDVCQDTGLSSATVSRVFSGSTPVSDETRKRVMEAANRLGYVPSHAGRALRSRRTHTIGAIFPEMSRHFYPDVLSGIDEGAAELRFDVLASFLGQHRRRSDLLDRMLGEGRVDALLLVNIEFTANEYEAAPRRVPIVLIGRDAPGSSCPYIGIDNSRGAELMIEHLLKQGHRRIATVTGPRDSHDSQQRLQGIRRALARAGLPLEPGLVWSGEFTFASGIAAAQKYLTEKRKPDAIFCLNDAMAIAMLGELRRSGVSVPGAVAVAGFDDVHESAHLLLTTIAAPMREIGQVAAKVAVDLVNGNDVAASQLLPVRLVVRDTSLHI